MCQKKNDLKLKNQHITRQFTSEQSLNYLQNNKYYKRKKISLS